MARQAAAPLPFGPRLLFPPSIIVIAPRNVRDHTHMTATKMSDFCPPFPCHVQNSCNLVPFVHFLGTPPTHCGRHTCLIPNTNQVLWRRLLQIIWIMKFLVDPLRSPGLVILSSTFFSELFLLCSFLPPLHHHVSANKREKTN